MSDIRHLLLAQSNAPTTGTVLAGAFQSVRKNDCSAPSQQIGKGRNGYEQVGKGMKIISSVFILALTGCGTVYTVRNPDRTCFVMDAEGAQRSPRYIYSGLRCDVESLPTSALIYGVGIIPVLVDTPLSLTADTVILPFQVYRAAESGKDERRRRNGPFVFRIVSADKVTETELVDLKPSKFWEDKEFSVPDPSRYKKVTRYRMDFKGDIVSGDPNFNDRFRCRISENSKVFRAQVYTWIDIKLGTIILRTNRDDFGITSNVQLPAQLKCQWDHYVETQ